MAKSIFKVIRKKQEELIVYIFLLAGRESIAFSFIFLSQHVIDKWKFDHGRTRNKFFISENVYHKLHFFNFGLFIGLDLNQICLLKRADYLFVSS